MNIINYIIEKYYNLPPDFMQLPPEQFIDLLTNIPSVSLVFDAVPS